MFRDDKGRAIIYHGSNAVVKIDPYIPSTGTFDPEMSLNDEDIDNLVTWGFNIMRMGVIWEAVERSPGVYDYDYLDKMETLVNKLG